MKFSFIEVNFTSRSQQVDKQTSKTFQRASGLYGGWAFGLLSGCPSADGKTGAGENLIVLMSCRSCLSLAMQVLFSRKYLFNCKIAAYSSVPRCPHLNACNAVLHNENNVLLVRHVYISQERSIPNAVLSS